MKRAFLVAVVVAVCLHGAVAAQQGGLNTSVLPGLPSDPTDPMAPFKSDLWQQRQLEPDILVSTRNHEHLLTFFNDYRGVHDPDDLGAAGLFSSNGMKRFMERILAAVTGRPADAVLPTPRVAPHPAMAAAEARVGYSRSYDGGLTWHGGLLGKIDGLDGMTDPKTTAAPCGIGYAAIIAFTRFGQSKVVVFRVQDTNNKDGGDTWQSHGYSILETANNATNGTFHDLPAIAVDPVRTATNDPCAHRVYVSWATFNGADGASKLSFARTTAGDGATWNPSWQKQYVKTGNTLTNQGVMLSVDPRPGDPKKVGGGGMLYLGWRTFATAGVPAGVWLATSRDYGETFGKAVPVNRTPVHFYDQPTIGTDATSIAEFLAFRSNSLPTMQVVPRTGGATVFVGWQERVNLSLQACQAGPTPTSMCGLPASGGEPRIVLTRSFDNGATWSDWLNVPNQRRAVDFGDRDSDPRFLPPLGFGYLSKSRKSGGQLMAKFTFGGGKFGMLYYEARGPITAIQGVGTFLTGNERQFDARFALLDPASGALVGTTQVSQYPVMFGANLNDGETEADIVKVDPLAQDGQGALAPRRINKRLNANNSSNGTKPFAGDYLGATPIVQFVFDRTNNRWRWAIDIGDVPFPGFRTVFADSRNQKPVADIFDYDTYVPPTYSPFPDDPNAPPPPPCTTNEGSRNHDVFHAFVDARVAVNAIATFKQLSSDVERAFPVTVTNGTATNYLGQPGNRFFRLSFDNNAIASWDQFNSDIEVFDVELFPYSSSTRVAYVKSGEATASVKVFVTEIKGLPSQPGGTVEIVPNGLTGTVTLNLDPTNPTDPGNDGTNVNEDHNPLVTNPLVTNHSMTPLVTNNALNPLVTNPLVTNNALNPLVTNPLVTNSSLAGETVYNITDTTWGVRSGGNVASAVATAVNVANAQQFDGSYVFQLLIHKTSTSAGNVGCTSGAVVQDQIISSIPNPLVTNPLVTNAALSPLVTNPLVTNATFALAPPPESGSQAGSQAMRVSGLLAAPVPPSNPADETQSDFKEDMVFVTLRAYQITAQPAVVFDPVANPPSIIVVPESVDIVDDEPQGTEPLPGSQFVVTNTGDSAVAGSGSLRAAILAANANTGLDVILFAIPSPTPQTIHTINLTSALPTITDPVILDGWTQPNFAGTPVIVLNGAAAGDANGLTVSAGLTTIRGLAIQNFRLDGIEVIRNGGNTIEGNYVGTDAAGATAQGNGTIGPLGAGHTNGIHVVSSAGNTIGGTTPAARNVVSGNLGEGIRLDGAVTTGNVIRGNYVGASANGSADLGNGNSGIFIRRAPGNSVFGNLVSGNNGFAGIAVCGNPTFCGGGDIPGVDQSSDAAGTIIQGNFVGTNAAGAVPFNTAIPNAGFGVSLNSTRDTTVGGSLSGEGNIIAFNGTASQAGVVVFGNTAIRNQILGNSIHSNNGIGIDLGTDTGQNGVTPNDYPGIEFPIFPDEDAGPNGLQNFPDLAAARTTGTAINVTGVLRSTPNTTFTLEFFYSTACDASGHGEGQTWFASQAVATDAAGNLPIDLNVGGTLPSEGMFVTATATSTDADTGVGTSEFSACVPVTTVDQWTTDAGGNGNFYEYVRQPGLSWTQAEALARQRSYQGLQGRLVSITSVQENTFVNNLRDGGPMRAWIGLFDADGTGPGTWRWSSGESLVYANWASGEPNNLGTEFWVEMFGDATWNNNVNLDPNPAFRTLGYIVEYAPVPPNLFVVTNTNDSGPGSLRNAITLAEANPGFDTIAFNISGTAPHTITPATQLPTISGDGVDLDATTQPGYAGTPLIQLSGATIPGADGLTLSALNPSVVRGLSIVDWENAGIVLAGGSGGNTIVSNYIGLLSDGTTAVGNGVGIRVSSANNLIGRSGAERNVISGNTVYGVSLSGSASGNLIRGNYIGTSADGMSPRGNGFTGIDINGANNNTIGAPGDGNIISGNNRGITVQGDGTTVQTNLVGLGANGTTPVPNSENGIVVAGSNNQIGGPSPSQRNIISGNGQYGVAIGAPGFPGTVANNSVQGNYIGTNAGGGFGVPNGTAGVANLQGGVALYAGPNLIGGIGSAGNLISGNVGPGVRLYPGANGNSLFGNFVGINAAGTGSIANSEGIRVEASATAIGSATAGTGNVISGHGGGAGVVIAANNNIARNNAIGTNALGNGPLANEVGLQIDGSDNALINNLVAFNSGTGVRITSGIGNSVADTIHSNGALGIDLGGDGLTLNDAGDVDSGPNELQNFPVISNVTQPGAVTLVEGTVSGLPNSTVILRLYVGDPGSCDSTGHGEGPRLLDVSSVVIGTDGIGTFSRVINELFQQFTVFTGTTTSHNGSTSEFSACFAFF